MRSVNKPQRWQAVPMWLLGALFLLTFLVAPQAGLAQEEEATPEPDSGEVTESEQAPEGGEEAPVDEDWDYDWGRERGEVVRMGEDIVIDADEKVLGDVVSVGGSVTIYGHVTGDVIAIGGSVSLMDGSFVKGDAVSVGGSLDREDGSILQGQETSVGMGPFNWARWIAGPRIHIDTHCGGHAISIWWTFLRYAGFFLVGMILYFAFPRRAGIVRQTTRSRFFLSLLTGFGSVIGVLILFVLLCITCIGIVVAIPGLFATILLTMAAGAVAVALLGEVLFNRDVKDGRSWLLTLLLGLGLLFVVQLVGQLIFFAGGVGCLIGGSINVMVKAAWCILILAGFGALILSRLGKRLPGTEPAVADPGGTLPPTAPGSPPPPGSHPSVTSGAPPPPPPSTPPPPPPPPPT